MTVVALGLAALAAIGSYWLTGRLSGHQRFGAIDTPGHRSLHAVPTARTGGLAIHAAVAVAIVLDGLAGWLLGRSSLEQSQGVGVVLTATAALAAISYSSDRHDMPVLPRLGAQVILGIIAVWGARLTIEVVGIPAWETVRLGRLAFPITILALVWMTNLYNFMDGMDGFAGGMTIVGFATLAWFAWRGGQPAILWLSLFVVGATAGFVVHNFPPAQIFMGDVGSVPLGFLAGGLSLMAIRDELFDMWVPLLIFSPFVVDATVTLARRIRRCEPIWRPHREHYYQRLVLAGWGHRRTVLAEYAVMLACGATAVLYVRVGESTRLVLLLAWAVTYLCLARGVTMVEANGSTLMRINVARVLLKYRRVFVIAVQLGAVVLSHYAAFWLRFDGDIPPDQARTIVRVLPWLIAVRVLSFVPFRLYEGLWRYAGFWDLRNIVSATVASTVALFIVVQWGLGLTSYPRSVFLTDSVLLIVILGGLRMSRRLHRELSLLTREKGVLIYGAGSAGELIVRDMRKNSFYEYEPVGFLDDDPVKVGQRIHGIKVLGTRDDLRRVMLEKRPDAVLIAISRAEPASIRAIVRALEPFKVPIQTLPNLRDVLGHRASVNQIRSLSVEDLLDRSPVALDSTPVQALFEGRRVLVTGAGGSIGAEVCRQIASFRPGALMLVERYENGLEAVFNSLAADGFAGRAHPIVADLTDEGRMVDVWRTHRPEIVLHAAAHKHVPMMERNPCEAVLNNVRGARMLIEIAVSHGIERFLMISTDKAVNPVNVMGATKRVGEMLVQTVDGASPGVFSAVRFGNVLASNGSVVPRFLEQIGRGGPVAVTHPEMRRYFMLIPEAVGLVLQAIAMAKGGDIFALEMGPQMKVLDLARNLIRLSGFVPNEEIQIVFTGPRPGEKLCEELIGADEEMEPSSVDGILRIRPRTISSWDEIVGHVRELERAAMAGDVAVVLDWLRTIVPTYQPSPSWRD